MLDILGYLFVQKALFAGVCISATCAFLGVFLVMRRYSLFGDAISHVAFGGVAIGLLMGAWPIWTALVGAILGGVGLERLRRLTSIPGDAAVAIILVSGLGVGVLAASATGGFGVDLYSFLFGNILLTSTDDVIVIAVISTVVAVFLFVLRHQLLYVTFSEEQARVAGIAVQRLSYLFIILTSVTVIMSIRLVGVLLVSALIVLPSITGIMLGTSFARTVLVSIITGVSSVIIGILVSAYYDLAPSGAIALVGVAILVGAIIVKGLSKKHSV